MQRRYVGRFQQPATQRKLYQRRRNYATAYMPSDYGGVRGAPADRVGRGFRGTYSRSQVEKKYIDIALANYAGDTTGSVTPLNVCNEGTGVSQRIGRKTCLKSVQVRGMIQTTDEIVANNMVRLMLVWDKQVNGVTATIAEILSAATSASFMNLDNRERFVVLWDKHFSLGQVSNTATQAFSSGQTSHVVNKYKKLPPGSFSIYDGTGAGIADINTGALYLVTIGMQAAGAGATCSLATRVRYTDS
nr:MAG: putative capsid protein [Arizlama virus]